MLATGTLWLTQITTFCWDSARELLLPDRFTVIVNTRANCVGFFLVDKWPPGHYCILAKGPCPTGFLRSSGHMRALKMYASSAVYIKPATFGDSSIQCHGHPCGRYGQWIGELYITACCKWWGYEITYLSTKINPINNQNEFRSDNSRCETCDALDLDRWIIFIWSLRQLIKGMMRKILFITFSSTLSDQDGR